MRTFAMLLFSIFLANCSTTQLYTGEKRSRSEVAVIRGDSSFNVITGISVVINEVDGKPINIMSNKVEVLPGKHKLTIKCEMTTIGSFNIHKLDVHVEAGKSYILGTRLSKSKRGCSGTIIET